MREAILPFVTEIYNVSVYRFELALVLMIKFPLEKLAESPLGIDPTFA